MPKLAAQLTPHFTVYTYDRRGRGASGDTPPYAAGREVDDIEALVELAGAGETVFVYGTSSGAALALEAAKRIPAIGKLAVYEPPFIVDDTRSPMPDDYLPRLNRLVADGRRATRSDVHEVRGHAGDLHRGDAAHARLAEAQGGGPHPSLRHHDRARPSAGHTVPAREWAAVKIPTLVAAGGKSPAWMTNGTRALADALPDARYRTLPGQNHMVKAQAIAPVLTEFFLAHD